MDAGYIQEGNRAPVLKATHREAFIAPLSPFAVYAA